MNDFEGNVKGGCGAGDVAESVECGLGAHEALGLVPSSTSVPAGTHL